MMAVAAYTWLLMMVVVMVMRAMSAMARIRIGRLHDSRLGASLCRHNAGRSAVVQGRRVDLSPCAQSHCFSHRIYHSYGCENGFGKDFSHRLSRGDRHINADNVHTHAS